MGSFGVFRFRWIWLALGFLGLLASCGTEPPATATRGYLSLEGLSFADQPYYTLDGEWDFFWGGFIAPSRIYDEPRDTLISVPGAWNSIDYGDKPLPGTGFATYHLSVQLDSSMVNQSLTLEVSTVRSAYRLYLNEELVIERGTLSVGNYHPRVQPAQHTFTPTNSTLEVVVHVANQQYSHGGMVTSLTLSPSEYREAHTQNQISLELAITGGLMILCLYHFILFGIYRRQKSTLYFGILCLIIALRTLLTGQYFWLQIFPQSSTNFTVRMEFGTVFLGPLVLLLFLREIFPQEVPRWLVVASTCVTSILVISLFIPNGYYFSVLLPLSHLQILVGGGYLVLGTFPIAILRRRKGAWLFYSALLILFLAAINDILYVQNVVDTGFLLSFGTLYFILVQSIALAIHYGHTYQQLKDWKLTLEQNVVDRTKSLQEKIKRLEDQQERYLQRASQKQLSLDFAYTLQHTISPSETELKAYFADAMVLNLPRYRVSGDFYWVGQSGECIVLVVGDGTGHNLEGGLLGTLAQAFLQESVCHHGETDPATLLAQMEQTLSQFRATSDTTKQLPHTLDMAVVTLVPSRMEWQFSGARIGLVRIANHSLHYLAGHKRTLRGTEGDVTLGFITERGKYLPGDYMYLYTDGWPNQMGGPANDKFTMAKLHGFLIQSMAPSLPEQRQRMQHNFERWCSYSEQMDDVLMVGVRL